MNKNILITGNTGHSALWILERKQKSIFLKTKRKSSESRLDSTFESVAIDLIHEIEFIIHGWTFETGNNSGELLEKKNSELLKFQLP